MYQNRYSHMIHEYYIENLRKIVAKRQHNLSTLKDADDARAYVDKVRNKVRRCFAPFPRRTALRPIITGSIELADYRIEKVLFQSRPGVYVTGNLYLPLTGQHRYPAVLGVCGHSLAGKAEPLYQSFCQNLVQKGFAVFIIDPISQGERRQFFPRDSKRRPSLCEAHNLMGNKMMLIDDFFGTWRAWDAIRGLDYLLSRPEVDTTRVGVTGNSGGGTLSTYVAALDDRITMAAPSCYICSYLCNLESELPGDAEQNPPGIIAAGLEQVDLLIACAPTPTLILGQYDDFFSERYARNAADELKHIHTLLGNRDTADVFIGPRSHGFYQENREAMTRWFMKHANIKGSPKERSIKPLPAEKLFVTKTGTILKNDFRRVFDISSESAAKLTIGRPKMRSRDLKERLLQLLRIPSVENPPHFRALSSRGGFDKKLRKGIEFAVESEPGIQVLLSVFGKWDMLMHPPKGKISVFVGNQSSQDDVAAIPEIKRLISGRTPLVSVDPRGIGQSVPKSCGSQQLFESYGADFMYAVYSDMMGTSYLGGRVFDVMRAMDFLLSEGATEIQLIGHGLNSITVAFAGFLHHAKPRVRLINYLPSYQLIMNSAVYKWPASCFLRGILKYFDLPDIYQALGKRLTKEKPWNADMKPLI